MADETTTPPEGEEPEPEPETGDGDSKDVTFEGSVTDDATGETTRVEGSATVSHEAGVEGVVTPISAAPSADSGSDGPTCINCGMELSKGRCINADCEYAQAQWSTGATRTTAKAAAAAAQDRPRAWSRSGGVD